MALCLVSSISPPGWGWEASRPGLAYVIITDAIAPFPLNRVWEGVKASSGIAKEMRQGGEAKVKIGRRAQKRENQCLKCCKPTTGYFSSKSEIISDLLTQNASHQG